MYKLTLTLLAFFSLALPIVAVPTGSPVSEVDGLEKRTTFNGVVSVIYSHHVRDTDLLA